MYRALPEAPLRLAPFLVGPRGNHESDVVQQLVDEQTRKRYLDGLERLTDRDRRLIVGRVELGYSYRQLALVAHLPSAEAARKALGRAAKRLIDLMSNA